MSLIPYILEQGLRQLPVPEEAFRQFQTASALSDVDGKGFPKDLFQLSKPVITRGLLNFRFCKLNGIGSMNIYLTINNKNTHRSAVLLNLMS
ncbi:MAG: hypothetical protein WAV76_05030 [Bacteroidota bacterium]